eukprot:7388658-Prymnesium_polylepis.3
MLALMYTGASAYVGRTAPRTHPASRVPSELRVRMCADCWMATSRELTLLPFDESELMLPGETKELVFKEAHHILQLEHCSRKHRGCLGQLLQCVEDAEVARAEVVPLLELMEVREHGSVADGSVGVWVMVKCVGRVAIRGEIFRNDGDGFDRALAMPYTDEERRPEETDEVDCLLADVSTKQTFWRELDARRAARILDESCAKLGGSHPDSAGALESPTWATRARRQ